MSKYYPLYQCQYNEACACKQKNCESCGWYPKEEKKEETEEENE